MSSPTDEPVPSPSSNNLQEEFRDLRRLVHVVLAALIVMCGSLLVFMLRENIAMRRQIRDHGKFVTDYKQTLQPKIDDFQARLQVFARSNPDFVPIFVKYFGSSNAPLSATPTNSGPGAGSAPPPVRPTQSPPAR